MTTTPATGRTLATLVFVAGALLSGKGLLDARRTTGSF
jgi:hypothetical protein